MSTAIDPTPHGRGTPRGDHRGGGRALRRDRAARHLHGAHRCATWASRSRTCSGSSAPRRSSSWRPCSGPSGDGRRSATLASSATTGTMPSGASATPTWSSISDRRYLDIQLQAYAATDDAEVRAVVQEGFGDLVNGDRPAHPAPTQRAGRLPGPRHAPERGRLHGGHGGRDGLAGDGPRGLYRWPGGLAIADPFFRHQS